MRAADVFRELEKPERDKLLRDLDVDSQAAILRILGYPEDSAGSIMTTEFVAVPPTWTVGRTLEHLREVESTRETIYAILVVDPAS